MSGLLIFILRRNQQRRKSRLIQPQRPGAEVGQRAHQHDNQSRRGGDPLS
jgi:hypothetical protein